MGLYFRLIIPLLWAPLGREFISTDSPACCQCTLCVILFGYWAHSPRRLHHIFTCSRLDLYRHDVYGWMRMAIGEVLYSLEFSRALVAQGKRPSKHIHLVKQIPVELWPVLVLIQSLVDPQSFKDRQICVTAYFIDVLTISSPIQPSNSCSLTVKGQPFQSSAQWPTVKGIAADQYPRPITSRVTVRDYVDNFNSL